MREAHAVTSVVARRVLCSPACGPPREPGASTWVFKNVGAGRGSLRKSNIFRQVWRSFRQPRDALPHRPVTTRVTQDHPRRVVQNHRCGIALDSSSAAFDRPQYPPAPKHSQHLYFGPRVRVNSRLWVLHRRWCPLDAAPKASIRLETVSGGTPTYNRVRARSPDVNHVLLSVHWYLVRLRVGLQPSHRELRREHLDRFPLRKRMGSEREIRHSLPLPSCARVLATTRRGSTARQGQGYVADDRLRNDLEAWSRPTNGARGHDHLLQPKRRPHAAVVARSVDRAAKTNGATLTTFGPSAVYLSILGAGKNLYTGRHGHDADPDIARERRTHLVAARLPDFTKALSRWPSPPNGILYHASITAGIWALKTKLSACTAGVMAPCLPLRRSCTSAARACWPSWLPQTAENRRIPRRRICGPTPKHRPAAYCCFAIRIQHPALCTSWGACGEISRHDLGWLGSVGRWRMSTARHTAPDDRHAVIRTDQPMLHFCVRGSSATHEAPEGRHRVVLERCTRDGACRR